MRRLTTGVALGVAAALAVTGCDSNAKESAEGSNGYDKKSVIFVAPSAPSDVFWASVQKGAKQAGKDLGADFSFVAPTAATVQASDVAQLLKASITKKPDAIVVANAYPEALSPLIKQATAAGIEVVEVNGGQDTWRSDGAIAYVGQSDSAAGVEAGVKMAEYGIKKAVCMTVPGFAVADQRCGGFAKGMKSKGAESENLNIAMADVGDATKLQRAFEGYLTTHKDTEAIMALGIIIWNPAVAALKRLKSDVKVATFDISTNALKSTIAGETLFVVDQQPYLEGYYGVQTVLQHLRYGLLPAGGTISTGPHFITKDDAADALKYNDLGVRGAA